jgi:hypothetical protein
MIQRTTAISSDVGDPSELISANPPPITNAAKAITKHANEAFRAPLHMKRDRERSGVGRPPFPSSEVIVHTGAGGQSLIESGPEVRTVEQVVSRTGDHGGEQTRH